MSPRRGRTSRGRRRTAGWLVFALGGALGCQPSFTPAEPVLGSIAYEWQATVPAAGAWVPLPGLPGIEVPPGAVPAGTTLTVRVTAAAHKDNPPGWVIPPLTGNVLQILPADVVFAHPLYATTISAGGLGGPGLAGGPIDHLFRADYADAAWTWSADGQAPGLGGVGGITWSLDRPGLWIWGQAPAVIVDGTYQLTGLSCSSGATSTPAGVYLTVAGDHYSLTATLAPSCHDEGALSISATFYTLETGGEVVGFDAQSQGTRLRLKAGGGFQGFCSASDSLILVFDFKGCSSDADCGAGGACVGQLCGPAPAASATSCLSDIVSAPGAGT